jgi:hypothetical protein
MSESGEVNRTRRRQCPVIPDLLPDNVTRCLWESFEGETAWRAGGLVGRAQAAKLCLRTPAAQGVWSPGEFSKSSRW